MSTLNQLYLLKTPWKTWWWKISWYLKHRHYNFLLNSGLIRYVRPWSFRLIIILVSRRDNLWAFAGVQLPKTQEGSPSMPWLGVNKWIEGNMSEMQLLKFQHLSLFHSVMYNFVWICFSCVYCISDSIIQINKHYLQVPTIWRAGAILIRYFPQNTLSGSCALHTMLLIGQVAGDTLKS